MHCRDGRGDGSRNCRGVRSRDLGSVFSQIAVELRQPSDRLEKRLLRRAKQGKVYAGVCRGAVFGIEQTRWMPGERQELDCY